MKTFAKVLNIAVWLIVLLGYVAVTPILFPIFVYMFCQDWRGVSAPLRHAASHWWGCAVEIVACSCSEPLFFKNTMLK